MFELDRMAQVLKVVTLLTVAVVFVYSTEYLRRRAILKGEYFVFGLFATWAYWCCCRPRASSRCIWASS
jgi:NADH-quinone oxidoreductase subunit N